MIDNELPETLIIGKQQGEWPIRVFSVRDHAVHWVAELPAKRRVWEITVTNPTLLRYIPPSEPRLEPIARGFASAEGLSQP